MEIREREFFFSYSRLLANVVTSRVIFGSLVRLPWRGLALPQTSQPSRATASADCWKVLEHVCQIVTDVIVIPPQVVPSLVSGC